VEVRYPGTFLDEHASLLDTPGIDSTDAAHKIATESALHLADVVIYMMDYNHVQAEENFNFTKTLKDRGKPVYLVVNMIDKHLDFELDFDSYKESVEEAFENWNIKPDGIFYTSLAEPDHPENQYETFRDMLLGLIANRESLVAESVRSAARHLVEEHIQVLKSRSDSSRREWEEAFAAIHVEGVESADPDQVAAALRQAEAEEQALAGRAAEARRQMEKELGALLDNARLTYYSTNEAAQSYLESRKPGFKMGLLFAGKKTEEEKARREEALLADLREKVAGNLDFHFKELMGKLPQQYEIRDEVYHEDVHATRIELTGAFLAAHVKDGAASREYVMNYCTDLSNAIKLEYRRAGLAFIERVAAHLEQQAKEQRGRLEQKLSALRKLAELHEKLAGLAASEQNSREKLQAILQEGA
jgi:hypothetical protein